MRDVTQVESAGRGVGRGCGRGSRARVITRGTQEERVWGRAGEFRLPR